ARACGGGVGPTVSRRDRQAFQLEGLCGVCRTAAQRHRHGVPRPNRHLQNQARSGDNSGEAAEGRADQALGYSLNRSRALLLALFSGVLLAVSFPQFGHPAFVWIALTPLLVAVAGQSVLRACGLGFVAGVVYFTGTLYWITRVMVVYGDVPWIGAVLINVALVALLALFVVIFSMVMARMSAANGAGALLAAPVVWVATELGRTYLLTGFPWVLL